MRNGTLLLHEHQITKEKKARSEKQMGTEIEIYDLVPVGTEMASLVPEKLVNCGYLDIMEETFPDFDLCWNGKDTNILLITEETYQELSQNLTPQTFSVQFHVDSKQENSLKGRFQKLIRTENMEFQSVGGYSENLNLFQITCKSDLLRKEQNYIQTSRLFLLAVSGCLVFIGIMNFLNVRDRNSAQKKGLYPPGKCGNDKKTVMPDVPVRKYFHLADTVRSFINP